MLHIWATGRRHPCRSQMPALRAVASLLKNVLLITLARSALTQGSDVDERPAEEQAASVAGELLRMLPGRIATVHGFLLDCAVELGHKVATYALLVGARSCCRQHGTECCLREQVTQAGGALASGKHSRCA